MGANQSPEVTVHTARDYADAARRLVKIAERAEREGPHFMRSKDSDALRLASIAFELETGERFSVIVRAARRLVTVAESAEYQDGEPSGDEADVNALRAALAAMLDVRPHGLRTDKGPFHGAGFVNRLDDALRTLMSLRLTIRMQAFQWSKPLPARTFANITADLCRLAGEHLECAHAILGGGGPGHFTRAPLTGPGFPSRIDPMHEVHAEQVRAALFALVGLEGVARLDYAHSDIAGFHAVAEACIDRAGAFVDDALRMFAGRGAVWCVSDDEDEPDLSDIA